MSDPPAKASAESEAGTIISVKRSPPQASLQPPPVWGGMASPPPPTRDFRGPFLFVGALAVVALVAILLLVYAVSMENRDRLSMEEMDQAAIMAADGGLADAATASLWVDGAPFGATVRLNADSVGTLPVNIEALAAGDHLLTIESGEQVLDTLISLRAGETAAVFLRLNALGDVSEAVVDVSEAPVETPPSTALPAAEEATPAAVPPAPTTARLRFSSQPSGATVRLDGVAIGTTPLVLPEVDAGTHTVSAILAGYQSEEMRIEVIAGRSQMVRLPLEPVAGQGTLEVLARPWGTIYIDGALKKRNTDVVYRAQLSDGTHEIRVVHPTFGTRTRSVTIQAGQTVMEVFDLTVGSTDDGS